MIKKILLLIKKILLWSLLAIILVIGVLFINVKVREKKSTIVTKGKPIENYQSNNSALLVIDIQEYTTGVVSINEVFKKSADDLIQKINRIIEKSVELEIPVIFIRSEISNPLINLINNSAAAGSQGAQLDSRLTIVSDYIVTKDIQDAFSNPILDSILIQNEISSLFVVGLDAAHCVNSTIEGARNRGYEVAAINDAIISDPDSVTIQMLNEFEIKGVEILSTEKLLTELNGGI